MKHKHKHSELIQAWLNDSSTKFEFAYGCGVDFTWLDCDVEFVFKNETSQIRIKEKSSKKEKRMIVTDGNQVKFVVDGLIYPSEWQLIEIEVEV